MQQYFLHLLGLQASPKLAICFDLASSTSYARKISVVGAGSKSPVLPCSPANTMYLSDLYRHLIRSRDNVASLSPRVPRWCHRYPEEKDLRILLSLTTLFPNILSLWFYSKCQEWVCYWGEVRRVIPHFCQVQGTQTVFWTFFFPISTGPLLTEFGHLGSAFLWRGTVMILWFSLVLCCSLSCF